MQLGEAAVLPPRAAQVVVVVVVVDGVLLQRKFSPGTGSIQATGGDGAP